MPLVRLLAILSLLLLALPVVALALLVAVLVPVAGLLPGEPEFAGVTLTASHEPADI